MLGVDDDGPYKVYREIYQDTSSGDFGIQIKDGPLLRCHSHILIRCGGFLEKVRRFGKVLSREVEPGTTPPVKEYFKAKGYTELLEDLRSIQFSQPMDQSALQGMAAKMVKREDPMRPGFSTAHFIGGTTGAIRRRDPFLLAERYEVDCDCERMAELLRFVYQGLMSFFALECRNEKDRETLTDKMLKICMDAEKYSVDALYEQLVGWFGRDCFIVVGERKFSDAFYQLEHFVQQCTEEHSKQLLIETVTGDMLATREQFSAITRDPRWSSLRVEFIEGILQNDGVPISGEAEVLSLIGKWNARTDKAKEDIVRLLHCFRMDEETQPLLFAWLRSMGWLTATGEPVKDLPMWRDVARLVDGSSARKQARSNLQGTLLLQAEQMLLQEEEIGHNEVDAAFEHLRGGALLSCGSVFSLGSHERLLQSDTFREVGIQRLRVSLSVPRRAAWNRDHEVFVGCSYGEGKYFGFLCSATDFAGIYSVRALASAAPEPGAPAHITGSATKFEFDLALEVQLQRANLIVMCKLSVIFQDKTVTEEWFQIAYDTLTTGAGLRFQVVATGLESECVDVVLSWVSNAVASDEKESIC
mmetsp:Transcript_61186/g.117992  ORF Transcript_61186/g.117992 Transcript_61186/m.117992 type:complete len:586 (+) Transcript_61186:123-1880(+)